MKKLSLIFLALFLVFSGFSQSKNKGTIPITYQPDFEWGMMVMCNGVHIGDLTGDVTIKARIHGNSDLTLDIVSGTLKGTGELEGETFKIKFHGKYYSEWYDDDFRVELHFIAKGNKGTKILNVGTFDYLNGPVSIKSKCF